VLFVTAVGFRPALPVDETRYLTVAWEMLLRHDWLAPLTVNFEPYHHKPPLLFWLIETSWSVFGVSRWAAVIPVVLASLGTAYLTDALSRRLLPGLGWRAVVVLVGCVAFLAYSTLILFDLTLTLFVVGALLSLLAYAARRRLLYVVLTGLLLGGGVLTKGPVAYLYVAFPILLAPWWMERRGGWASWYAGGAGALLISVIPVLLWLVPVLASSTDEFGRWLIWEQTAGRVTGSYGNSHPQPPYFYLLILPVLLLPWTLFPGFWTGLKTLRGDFRDRQGIRFLVLWIVPTIAAFSLIAGKQPHYMVPLLPGLALLIARATAGLSTRALQLTTAVMITGFVVGHAALSAKLDVRYGMQPVADFVHQHSDHDWSFTGRHYRGELSFLARLDGPVDTPKIEELPDWFVAHPRGYAVVSYRRATDVAGYELLVSTPYRGRQLGVVSGPTEDVAAESDGGAIDNAPAQRPEDVP